MRELTPEIADALITPSGYAVLRLGIDTLYLWQVACMDALERRQSRAALRTCNESGKTSTVIASVVLWHMETFANSLTVTTSGSYRQIVDQLYPHLRAQAERLEHAEGRRVFRILKDRGECQATGSRLISFSTDNAGRAEGWHEPPLAEDMLRADANLLAEFGISDAEWGELVSQRTSLLIIIDEAKTVPQGIWDAFERCHPTRFLAASSPGGPWGAFYDCFTSQRSRYRLFHAAASDCPHLWEDPVRRRELREQEDVLGPALVASMIRGEFADSGEGLVFDMAAVAAAMGGTLPRWGRGSRRAAIDLSGGGDEQVLFLRDGNDCWIEGAWHEKDDAKLVREVVAKLQGWQMRPEWVYADGGGLGQPILNAFDRTGWRFNRIDFGAPARDTKHYANVRAEMYFRAAQRIRLREVRLPRDDLLRQQLGWIRHVPYEGGQLKLIPKHKLPASPDRADALAMLLYDLPAAADYRERQDQLEAALSPTRGAVPSEGGFSLF